MSGAIAASTALSVGGSLIQADASKDAARTMAGSADRASEITNQQFQQTRQDQLPYQQVATGDPIYETDPATGERVIDPQTGQPKITGYTGGALQELAGFGRSRVREGEYIPASEIPEFNQLDLNLDPGYQFRKDEQDRAINRGSAVGGKVLSGNRLEEIMARSGQLASQEYGAAYNRNLTEHGLDTAREADIYGRGVESYGRARGEETDYLNRLANLSRIGQTSATNTAQFGANAANQTGQNIIAAGQANAAGQIGRANAITSGIGDITSLAARYRPGNTYQNGSVTTDYNASFPDLPGTPRN